MALSQVNVLTLSLHLIPCVILVGAAIYIWTRRIMFRTITDSDRKYRLLQVRNLRRSLARAMTDSSLLADHSRRQLLKDHVKAMRLQMKHWEQNNRPPPLADVDTTELQRKYAITNRPLLLAASVIFGSVLVMSMLSVTLHWSLAWIVVIGAMMMLLTAGIFLLRFWGDGFLLNQSPFYFSTNRP